MGGAYEFILVHDWFTTALSVTMGIKQVNKMEDDSGVFAGETVEDFLDSHSDLFYLEDQELARQLVELGRKGSSLEREEFETRKAAAEASRLASGSQKKKLASTGKELKDNFLRALAEREEANRSGEMTFIIFIRDRNSHGQEISGYIDPEDFEPYFSGKKRLIPKPTDLRIWLFVRVCHVYRDSSHSDGNRRKSFL